MYSFCWFLIPFQIRTVRTSTPCQRKHTKGRAQATNQPPNNSDLSNLSPANLPVDDSEPEKEVCEEKEDPLAGGREGGGRRRKEERGRTKQRMSLAEQGTSAQEETSSRVQAQSVKRGRASMPVRESGIVFCTVCGAYMYLLQTV